MTLLLQATEGSASTTAAAAPSAAPAASAAPATSAVSVPAPGADKGLAGGPLFAPAWLVVLLALLAVSLAAGFFVLRSVLRRSKRGDESIAPMSSRR